MSNHLSTHPKAENIFISVLVPCYNVEKYIAQCLDSIVNQTYHNLEIVLLNDASTDDTLAILDSYHQKDNRIKLINLAQNREIGVGRNTLIEKATGEYYMFVDADDWLNLDTVESLVKYLEKTKNEVVLFGHSRHFFKSGVLTSTFHAIPKLRDNLPKEKKLKYMLASGRKGLVTMNCIYLVKRDIIVGNNLKYRSDITFEDGAFIPQIIYYAKSVGVIKKSLYNYRMHIDSKTSIWKYKEIYSYIVVSQEIKKMLIDNNDFETYKNEYLCYFLFYTVQYPHEVYYTSQKFDNKDIETEKLLRKIRQNPDFNFKNIFALRKLAKELDKEDELIRRKFKFLFACLILLRINYKLYSILLNFWKFLRK